VVLCGSFFNNEPGQLSNSIRVIQITDCHLPADPDQLYRGIKPYETLRLLLPKVAQFNPDLVLATGDLSEDGSLSSYQSLRRFFEPLKAQVLALPGNHDDAITLAGVFPGSPVDEIAVSRHGAWQIIRLNSCLPGKPEGQLGEKMLSGLAELLRDGRRMPGLIAVHHQPIAIGSEWIDKYRLFESDAFLKLVDENPGVKIVSFGHVHQQYAAHRSGTAMLGGPSSAINGLKVAPKFTDDGQGAACRWFELRNDGTFETGVLR
jgi:Icc protein